MESDKGNNSFSLDDGTLTEEYILPEYITYIFLTIHVIIIIVGLVGNSLVVAIFFIKKRQKTNAKCYITAIAISDCLFIIFSEPVTIFSNLINFHWIFGSFMCSAIGFIQTSCVIQRSFLLVTYCLDRYYAIRWPLKMHNFRKALFCIILSILLVSLVFPIPIALYSEVVVYDESSNAGMCIEMWPLDEFRRAFSASMLVLTYILPLAVMAVTIRLIVRILGAKPPGEEYEAMLKRRRTRNRKVNRVFLFAFLAYGICWLPIHVITIIGEIFPQIYDNKTVHITWLVAHAFAVSNAVINPINVIVREWKSYSNNSRISSVRMSQWGSENGSKGIFRPRSQTLFSRPPSLSRLSISFPSRYRRSEPTIFYRGLMHRSSTMETCV